MRLFYQLTENEQNDVLNHCTGVVVDDIINEGISFINNGIQSVEPMTAEDLKLKENLEAAIKKIQVLNTIEEKENFLMNDEVISKAIYDIATEMAKGAFYHEDDELVIFPNSLKCDHEHHDEILDTNINTKKTPHSLN